MTLQSKIQQRLVVIGSTLTAVLFLYYSLIQPSLDLWSKYKSLPLKTRALRQALNRQDLKTTNFELNYLRQDIKEIREDGQRIGRLSFLPFAGGYFSDLRNLSAIALEGYDLIIELSRLLSPLSKTIVFDESSKSRNVSDPAALNPGLAALPPNISQNLRQMKPRALNIAAKITRIDEKRYPETFKGRAIRQPLGQIKNLFAQIDARYDDWVAVLEKAPEALGTFGAKNYLVLIQNESERRPGGGRLGGYSIIQMENGRFHTVRSGDISFLDEKSTTTRPLAPDIVRQTSGENRLFMRQANYSPDFKEDGKILNDLWLKTPGSFGLAGIVAIDTHFLKSLIKVLGEIRPDEKTTVSRENAAEVFAQFFRFVGDRSPQSRPDKNLMSNLLNEMLKKIFAFSLGSYDSFSQEVWLSVRQKHLVLYFTNEGLQNLAEKFNLAGRIKDVSGNYLAVIQNTHNPQAPVLSNVSLALETDGTKVNNGLELTFFAKEASLSAGQKNLTQIYLPKSSRLVGRLSDPIYVKTGSDPGKTVLSFEIKFEGEKEKKVTLGYETKFGSPPETQRLLLQKQIGETTIPYRVVWNGQREIVSLESDWEFVFD